MNTIHNTTHSPQAGIAMKHLNALKTLVITSIATLATTAMAHNGHGMGGSHWHATDVGGFVAVAAVIGLAIWFSRSDK